MTNQPKSLFNLLGTPVTAEPSAAITPTALFSLTLFLSDNDQPWAVRFCRAVFMVLAYEIAVFGHTIGHIISARQAQAPMGRFHLTAPMPQTIYHNEDVLPAAHQMRAIGGPISSIILLLITLLWRPFTAVNSVGREFLTRSAWLHSFIGFGSLMPLPFIDGGALIKWSQVKQGRTPDAAEAVVEETNLFAGAACALVALILALLSYRKTAIACLGQAVVFIGAGLGKINR